MADQDELRYAPTVERIYRSDTVEVTWEPSFCIHFAACIRAAPEVFNPNLRPWVAPQEAAADRVIDAARGCPTGALHARLLTDIEREPAPSTPIAQTRRNGPLFVTGLTRITDAEGNLVREDTRMALCRCGGSSNKPFCDGTHRTINFRSDTA